MTTPTPDKNSSFAKALAAFIAGAGLGAGTTITVTKPGIAPSGWECEVMVNDQVLCSPIDSVYFEDSIIINLADGGTEEVPADDKVGE